MLASSGAGGLHGGGAFPAQTNPSAASEAPLPLSPAGAAARTSATTVQIQALSLEQLEALADALLDFQGPADLATWLAAKLPNRIEKQY